MEYENFICIVQNMLKGSEGREESEAIYHQFLTTNLPDALNYLLNMLDNDLLCKESLVLMLSLFSVRNIRFIRQFIPQINEILNQISLKICTQPNIIEVYPSISSEVFAKVFTYFLIDIIEIPIQYLIKIYQTSQQAKRIVLITMAWILKLDKIQIEEIFDFASQEISLIYSQPYDKIVDSVSFLLATILNKQNIDKLHQFSENLINLFETVPIERLNIFISDLNDIYIAFPSFFSLIHLQLLQHLLNIISNASFPYEARSIAFCFIGDIITNDIEWISEIIQELFNSCAQIIINEVTNDEENNYVVDNCKDVISDMIYELDNEEFNNFVLQVAEQSISGSEWQQNYLGLALITLLSQNEAVCLQENIENIIQTVISGLDSEMPIIRLQALNFLQIKNDLFEDYAENFINSSIEAMNEISDEDLLLEYLEAIETQVSLSKTATEENISNLSTLVHAAVSCPSLIHQTLRVINKMAETMTDLFFQNFNQFQDIIAEALTNLNFVVDGAEIIKTMSTKTSEIPLIEIFCQTLLEIDFESMQLLDLLFLINVAAKLNVFSNFPDQIEKFAIFLLNIANMDLLPLAEDEAAATTIIIESGSISLQFDEEKHKILHLSLKTLRNFTFNHPQAFNPQIIYEISLKHMKSLFEDVEIRSVKLLSVLTKYENGHNVILDFFREPVYSTVASRLCQSELLNILEDIRDLYENPLDYINIFITVCHNFVIFNQDKEENDNNIISHCIYDLVMHMSQYLNEDVYNSIASSFSLNNSPESLLIWSTLCRFNLQTVESIISIAEDLSNNDKDRQTVGTALFTIISTIENYNAERILNIAISMIDSEDKLEENSSDCNLLAYRICKNIIEKTGISSPYILEILQNVEGTF